MHAGCQNASAGLSERLLFTWELCKLTYRLWISNEKASLMLLHFGFSGQLFLRNCLQALKIPYCFNFKIWNV